MIQGVKEQGLAALSRQAGKSAKGYRVRSNFNEMGDFEGHYGLKPPGLEGRVVLYPTQDELATAIDRINRAGEELRTRGVRPFFFIPIVAEHGYSPKQEVADARAKQLKEGLTIPILNPDTLVYPTENYFDSCYHMQDEPGRRRTELLVSALVKELDKQPPD